MSNYKEIAETFFTAAHKLKFECLNHIKEILNNQPEKRITWLNDEIDEIGLEPLTIGYDGGNHPEYASNMFSEVEGVHLNEYGNIIFDLADGEMYAEYMENAAEIYYVCDFLDCLVNYMAEEND